MAVLVNLSSYFHLVSFCFFKIFKARNTTKTAMKVFHDVLDALSGDLATGQEPQVIEGERLSALVMKMHVERLSGSSISFVGGSFVLSNMEEILESWDEEDCYILAKVKLKNMA